MVVDWARNPVSDDFGHIHYTSSDLAVVSYHRPRAKGRPTYPPYIDGNSPPTERFVAVLPIDFADPPLAMIFIDGDFQRLQIVAYLGL